MLIWWEERNDTNTTSKIKTAADDPMETFAQGFEKSFIARLGYRTPLEVLQKLSFDRQVADLPTSNAC